MSADHFSRIRPIVGISLHSVCICVVGLVQATPLIEYLAASGVARWIWHVEPDDRLAHDAAVELQQRLAVRHGAALGLTIECIPLPERATAPCDLVLACAEPAALRGAYRIAEQLQVPALLCLPGEGEAQAMATFPGEDPAIVDSWIKRQESASSVCQPAQSMLPIMPGLGQLAPGPHPRAIQDAPSHIPRQLLPYHAPLVAGLARAILLRSTPYARVDIEQLWAQGWRCMQLGGGHPFEVAWLPAAAQRAPILPRFQTPMARRGSILIAGLGSIGSVAAAQLAPHARQLVLADPDCVRAANPARQHYTPLDIGQPKAIALRSALVDACPAIVATPEALVEEHIIDALIVSQGVTAALVATGTQADFAIARALRARGIPHVVARCYPRARYWEAILVDGASGAAFADLRGHVQLGPAAAPTPEQVAAYSDLGALEAEPATLVESGWAAAWAAYLVQQLAAPSGLRERWLLELLAAGRTCLVGGASVEETANGPAYAVDLPGRIWAWGREQVAGVALLA